MILKGSATNITSSASNFGRATRIRVSPYNTKQNAVVLGDQYVKGQVYITSSNQNVILHVCFKDSCGNDANKTGVTIPVD